MFDFGVGVGVGDGDDDCFNLISRSSTFLLMGSNIVVWTQPKYKYYCKFQTLLNFYRFSSLYYIYAKNEYPYIIATSIFTNVLINH